MRCEQFREAFSARLDGEDPPPGTTDLERHVRGCPACASFARASAGLHRTTRVRAAEAVPDLTGRVLEATSSAWNGMSPTPATSPGVRVRAPWARAALLVTALTQLALALPELVWGDEHGAGVHVAHEQGSWEVALAFALVVVVWRPVRAAGLLPFVGALAVVLAGTAVVDITQGRAPALGEAHHLLDFAGIAFLWLLTPPVTRRTRRPLLRLPRPAAW